MRLYIVKNLKNKKEFKTNYLSELSIFLRMETERKPDQFRTYGESINPGDPITSLDEFIETLNKTTKADKFCFGPYFIDLEILPQDPELEPAPGSDLDPQAIINLAIDTFGETAQIVHAIQELSELTQALTKYLLEADPDVNHIEEEIADVNIMCRQLEIIFNNENVRKWEQFKIKRLNKTIEKQAAALIMEHLRGAENEKKI